MENFDFYRPTAYYFGNDRERETGSIIRNLGCFKVFVIYGCGSAVRSGLIGRVEENLASAGLNYVTAGGVVPNPRADLVYELIERGRAENVDFVLAVGGGSVIDTAKAVAIGIVNEGDFYDFWLHTREPNGALGVGVILTIPAAGSEGSSSSVIQKETPSGFIKAGLTSPYNVPVFAIMNPELTKSLPAYQTACGAVDMMAHVMERYFTNTTDVSITDRSID